MAGMKEEIHGLRRQQEGERTVHAAGREALRQPDGRARLAMHPRTAPDAEESRTASGPPRLAALAAARRL